MLGKTPKASSEKQGKIIPREVNPPKMILIPEGMFIMGIADEQVRQLVIKEDWATEWYTKDLFLSEQPQHMVSLPAYEIGRVPVTNQEYHQFAWSSGHPLPRDWIGFHYPEAMAAHPVVGITKSDALAYCQWISAQTRMNFRLPTEAEWERAARGVDTRLYPWGEEFDPWRCNTDEGGKRETTEVGVYSPSGDSPWGVADMAGNVWEWTASLLQPYPYNPNDGREDPERKGRAVIRGGSWYYSRKLARCTAREGALHTFTSPALGFRLARTP